MELRQHLFLTAGWVLFCVLHSFLAAPLLKKKLEGWMKGYWKYYKISYSLFALFTLAAVLLYQFSFESRRLLVPPTLAQGIAVFLCVAGMMIMGWCIRKYFFYLSGIDVFTHERPESLLQRDGLHKYVRHPLYLGTLLFIWSLFLLMPYLNNLIACLVITLYIAVGIKLEERKLLDEFGDDYKDYRQRVPMLFPTKLSWSKSKG